MSRWVALIAVLVLGVGCMPASWRLARKLEGKYQTGKPSASWVAVPSGGADRAWHNAQGSTIYTDSNCGNRFAEARVEDLATEMTSGFQGVTTDLEVRQAVGPREGIVRTHTARLDGVPIRLGVAVVNHDWCTYDFVMITPVGQLDTLWPDFQAVIDGFRVQP